MAFDPREETPLYPVGELMSAGQLAAELQIASDRMLISAGAFKQWSERMEVLSIAILQKIKEGKVEA